MAYRIKSYQVMGADWIATERFDVNAKLPEGAAVDQIPAMIQSLLSERFALKFHREPNEANSRGRRLPDACWPTCWNATPIGRSSTRHA